MGEENVRWTIVVDKSSDINLRTRLSERGLKKGQLSKFVEDAVNRQLLRETINEIRGGFSDLTPEEAQTLVDGALADVRKHSAG